MSNYTAPASPSTTPAGAPPEATGAAPQAHPGGPPYPPTTAQLGLQPSLTPDIPISAVFLGLFVMGAATNMTIFQLNQRKSYKFIFSVLLFGFCMARIVALTMRIVWATRPRDVNVGIASQIFTAAGVLILFITNLVFAQRIIRAYHPFFGWSRGVTWLFRGLFGSVILVLIMVISVTVQSFFTLDEKTRKADRGIQLFCATFLAVYAFLPVPLVTLAALVPRRTRIDKFGEGHFRTKFALLTFTATLLAAGAIFRAVVNFFPTPIGSPAWYHGKAAYYCFNFLIEVVVVYTYALTRFDKRFHIPDGSSAPGHYSCSAYGGSDTSGLGLNTSRCRGELGGMMIPPGGELDKRRTSSSYTYDKVQDGPVRGSSVGGGGWPMRNSKRASTVKSVRSSGPSVGSSGSMYSSVAGGPGGMMGMAAPLPHPPSVHGHSGGGGGMAMMVDVELDGGLGGPGGPAGLDAAGDGATRAEDLAWMSRALVSSFSPEFAVPRLREPVPFPTLNRPLPNLPPAPPPREYAPLLAPPPLLEPDEGYGYGWHIWPVHERPEGEQEEEEENEEESGQGERR
ncbi:hypothetical protein QBC44DRAFT_335661 [Cladorrhinum sp. PSN332]|nr:hypothetical protein QBC44DRAFT_335661 [Cladorrhinum sp. PSN332]